jgi:hypothetical protein
MVASAMDEWDNSSGPKVMVEADKKQWFGGSSQKLSN